MTLEVFYDYANILYQEKEYITLPSTKLLEPQWSNNRKQISTPLNIQAYYEASSCAVLYQTWYIY